MGVYTIHIAAYSRRFLDPSEDIVRKLMVDAGNETFKQLGQGPMGQPIFECENKPVDSTIHGLKWIKVNNIIA